MIVYRFMTQLYNRKRFRMTQYFRYILRRVALMAVTLFIIISGTFLLVQFLPGSPFANEELLTVTQLALLYEKYGLNEPIHIQYFSYIRNVLKGDFGVFLQFNNIAVTQFLVVRAVPAMQFGLQ